MNDSDPQTTPRAPGSRLPMAAGLALLALALVVAAIGGTPDGRGWLLPVSVAAVAFVAGLWLARPPRRWAAGLAGLALAVLGAHLALWLPFVLVSDLAGQGAARIDYAAGAALVTAVVVAWYVMTGLIWQTLAIAAGLAALAILYWRRSRRIR